MNKNIMSTTFFTVLLGCTISFVAVNFSKLVCMQPESHNQAAQQICNVCNLVLDDSDMDEAVRPVRLTCNHTFHPQCLKNILLANETLSCPICETVIEVTIQILNQVGLTQEELFKKLRESNVDHELLTTASQLLSQLETISNNIESINHNQHQHIPQILPIRDENVLFLILIFAVIFSTLREVYSI